MKQLHLLNGDSTLHQFKQSNISGDTFVWREILCEGPTLAAIGSVEYWNVRAGFLKKFSVDNFEKYFDQLREEMENMDISSYGEVVLWFEYDLFCQINLLGAISWLRSKARENAPTISLVCLGTHPDYDRLVGLGEIDAQEYTQLLKNRQILSALDLSFAEQVWQLYCSKAHDELLDFIKTGSSTVFTYLKPAIEAHYQRFPNQLNGLTEIEQTILQFLAEEAKTANAVVGRLLRRQSYYGFGDVQYFKVVQSLAPLFREKNDQISLNEKGKAVLENKESFRSFRTEKVVYGGAFINAFHWNTNTGLLQALTE